MADLTPITRKEHFLSRAAGGTGLELKPNTREEHFLAAIAGSGPSPGPGGEVTPASIVTATGQMSDEQKAQTRDNLGAISIGDMEDEIAYEMARKKVLMAVNSGNLVLDLENWGGIQQFAGNYSNGLNVIFALPMLYLDQTAAVNDGLVMQLIGSDTENGVFYFEGVRGGKRYYARITPISANVLSGPLVITDNITTPASIVTATGQMTEAQAAATRRNIGAGSVNPPEIVEIEQSSATIEPEDNTIYQCGTLTSLTIYAPVPVSGAYSIVFTSGSTPTVTTIPATILGLESFAPEANTIYEINVLDNRAVIGSWAVSV